jgi:hypothetical protein
MLAVYAGLLILIAVATGVVTFKWLSSPSQDHLVVIGNFLMLGTLLLALVAGIVALAAYSAATGLPNLKLQFKLSPAQFNEVIFSYPLVEGLPPVTSDNGTLSLVVKNTSSYAARTPVVSVEFRGAGIPSDKYAPSEGWMPTARDLGGYIIALQWDGGPNSIHGISSRSLPELNLEGIYPSFGRDKLPEIVFRLLADGYNRPDVVLPMSWGVPSEYEWPKEKPREWL